MFRITASLAGCLLAATLGVAVTFSALAQPALSPTPTPVIPVIEPSPTPSGTPVPLPTLAPEALQIPVLAPSPTPVGGGVPSPVPLQLVPSPAPTVAPLSPGAATLTATPTPAPTPLPDGTMPWTPPPMPTPVPLDAATLSEDLNLPNPLPAPPQLPESLKPMSETEKLKQSDQLAMQQKMVMADFEKQLNTLIAKQRNANVPDMSLDGAVQIALKQNPDILNAIQQIRLTRGQLIEVIARAVPQLGISTGFSQQGENLARGTRGVGSSTSIITLPNPSGGAPLVGTIESQGNQEVQNQSWNVQFQATQLIFDGGATIAGIQGGTSVMDSAMFTLRATIDGIVAQIIAQFYQIVLNRALIVAQEQNVELLSQQVKDQQNRFDAGTVPRFNVLQAEVALANAKPPLIQAQNNYRIALYQLVQLLGMDYPEGHPSEVPFNVVGVLGYSPRKINTDESIRVSIARNPSLKAQRKNILAQASNVTAQIAGWMPQINANVGYGFQNDIGSMDLTDTVEGWFFGATGSWAVWDGGATYGRVAQAKAQMMQSKNNYDNSVRQIVLNVQTAISNLQQAKETIDSQTASVVQATEALRLSRERLDAGAGTQLDVLNAQVQLLQAQTNVLQARYDYIAAMASYDQALSLDTQYVETFDDPLTRPLNPQALRAGERKQFQKSTNPENPQAKLPRVFKGQDPVKPILESAPAKGKTSGKSAASATAGATPKPKKKGPFGLW